MSNYGQQPPYGQNPPNPYGQQQPGPYGQQPQSTGNRQRDANRSRRIPSRARTVNNRVSTRSSSHTVSPAKGRTGSSRRSGLRNRPL